jgi:hypothetical protein
VHGIEEALGVGFEAYVSGMQSGLEILVLLVKGVLAVGQGYVSLQEEGMGRVTDDGVIGVLAALGGNSLRRKGVVGFPEAEKGADIAGIADLLEGDDVRPEGVAKPICPSPWRRSFRRVFVSRSSFSRWVRS